MIPFGKLPESELEGILVSGRRDTKNFIVVWQHGIRALDHGVNEVSLFHFLLLLRMDPSMQTHENDDREGVAVMPLVLESSSWWRRNAQVRTQTVVQQF
jgi:hypothetical protein